MKKPRMAFASSVAVESSANTFVDVSIAQTLEDSHGARRQTGSGPREAQPGKPGRPRENREGGPGEGGARDARARASGGLAGRTPGLA